MFQCRNVNIIVIKLKHFLATWFFAHFYHFVKVSMKLKWPGVISLVWGDSTVKSVKVARSTIFRHLTHLQSADGLSATALFPLSNGHIHITNSARRGEQRWVMSVKVSVWWRRREWPVSDKLLWEILSFTCSTVHSSAQSLLSDLQFPSETFYTKKT